MAVRKDGTLHYNSGKRGARWQQAGVRTMDVGIGGGWVWLTNTQRSNGGGQIWRSRYTPGKWRWQRVPSALMWIDVDPRGNAWGLNDKNRIFRFDGRKWVPVPGQAADIGIGGNGAVWGIASRGFNANGGGGQVYKYNPKIKGHWQVATGTLSRISVDPQGRPFGANSKQQIWRVQGSGGVAVRPPPRSPKKKQASNKIVRAVLTADQTRLATDTINRLIKRMPLLPNSIESTVKSMIGSVKLIKGTNYYGINKGNVYVYVERPGATKKSGAGTSAFLLIKGRITPNLPGFFNNFKGSDINDLVLSAVKTLPKELNQGKRKREEIYLKDLPRELQKVVKKHYKDMISFPAGFQAAGAITLRGLFGGAVKAIGLPNNNLTLRVGMEQPEYSLSGTPPPASDTTFYAELIRLGAWKKPFNLAGTTIWDTTIGINTDLIMKVSGYGHVNRGNNFVLYYDGPVPRQNIPPDDLKKIAFAFGAAELSYKEYLNLMLSFQVPQTGTKKLRFVDKVGGFSNGIINGIKKGMNVLPLDALKIIHPKLKAFKKKQGAFPPPELFVLQGVGPKGKMGDENGPLVRISGTAKALGMHVASLTGYLKIEGTKSTLQATGAAGDSLSLGPFGRVGMKGTIGVRIDAQKQFFGMTGKLNATKLAGRDFTLSLKPSRAYFYSPATCTAPFDLKTDVSIDPRKMSLKNIPFSPLNTLPDPKKAAKCLAGVLYAVKDGVVYAFKGGKRVAEFADKLMQKNEATKLASGAVKFAGGKTVKAAGEAAKLIRADKAAGAASKALKAGAAEAAKRARQAKAEAAKRAKEAAQAAKMAANLTKDIAKNVAGSAAKRLSDGLKGIGGAIGGLFKKKKRSAPPRPPNPNDCSDAQNLEPRD